MSSTVVAAPAVDLATASPNARRRRLLVGGTAAIGAAAAITGALLPWLSLFAGLIDYPGVRGANGRIVLGGGVLVLLLAAAFVWRGGARLRLAIGLTGFALAAFCGYLLGQLPSTYHQLTAEPIIVAKIGPGLFVSAAGALLVFATLFLPSTER